MASVLRIGSRPSRLALAQAELVRQRLSPLLPSATIEVIPIRTSGDRMTTAALAEVGGKGLFIKELEQALVQRRIDLAVHSMKDLPALLAPVFRIAAVPERADPRDALLARTAGDSLDALPNGARLGTSSARRRFEALRLRPDLDVVALRGNLDTRLARLAAAKAGAAEGLAADAAAPSVATALHGRRVVITRASAAGGAFAVGLRALGAEVFEFPTIELVAPDSYTVVDAAIARLASFDWVIFTSASGVERMIERMEARGVDSRALGGTKLSAIGPATAARLAAHTLAATAMPTEYRAEPIVEAIGAARIRGARILIPRAQVAREVLPEMLAAAGAREVVVAPVYKTVKPTNAPVERVRKMITAGTIDLVAFTSSSTVTNFCEMIGADAARGLKAAAIGPITAETARAAGMEVAVQPTEYTVSALIAAIHDFFTGSKTP